MTPNYARAWHALIAADGTISADGGRLLTIGIDSDGQLWLSGDAIGGARLAMSHGTAAWLAGTLFGAVMVGSAVPRPRGPQETAQRPPVPAPDGAQTCGAFDETGAWSCTAQPGHGGPDHVCYAPSGLPLRQWPVTARRAAETLPLPGLTGRVQLPDTWPADPGKFLT